MDKIVVGKFFGRLFNFYILLAFCFNFSVFLGLLVISYWMWEVVTYKFIQNT